MASLLAKITPDSELLDTVDERKLRGAIYTPPSLADWVAELVRDRCTVPDPTVVDFGCGEGALLGAISRAAPASQLIGVETNALAAFCAKQNLPRSATLITSDVLCPANQRHAHLRDHWLAALRHAPSAVIMNPPWGAVHNLSKSEAIASGLKLAMGQYDTYDLFCELAIQVIEPNGAYGFILPDSIFLPEHQRLRTVLLSQTTISLIARLGEGIFPGIYRGCVVMVGNVAPPPKGHAIECLRLTKSQRALLKSGVTFTSCREALSHQVLQSRFSNDPESRFDIDVTNKDSTVLKMLELGGAWTGPLESRRGAEISKTGRVTICTKCGSARPLPKVENPVCFSCGAALSVSTITSIIADAPSVEGEWSPFIAGEDVLRYEVQPRRWIRTDLPGISYKKKPRTGSERILVRKTGVGLNAAIDSSGSYANQVVFEYKLNGTANFSFSYLHYVLGVFSSRMMFAFHLKRGGDLEWRSHPYVTQKSLSTLPIPLPRPDTFAWKQAAAIAKAVDLHLKTGTCDLEIEALVAGLYGMDSSDVEWALNVIEEAANLEPMRRLRLASSCSIKPIVVA